MTRQTLTGKWLIYLMALLAVWFLEAGILRRLPYFGVFPMLLPLAAVAAAVLEGPAWGAAFGLAVGVIASVSYYGTGGGMILGLTLLGALAGLVSQYWLSQTFWGFFLSSAGALLVLDGFRVLWRLLAGVAPLPALLHVAGQEMFWSLLFSPLVYLLFRLARRRFVAFFL